MSFFLPVYGSFDLIVIGGATGGVAAALSAKTAGHRVFIAAQESYFGEDICATGRLVFPKGVITDSELAKKIYSEPVLRPLAVKATLEEALVEKSIPFEFGAVPLALLKDPEGLAGVVLSGKGGAFAVLGRAIIDTTPAAQLARIGGAAFAEWPTDAETTFSRVRLTSDTAHDGTFDELGRISLPDSGSDEWSLRRTSFRIPVPKLSPDIVALAESKLRDATWTPKTSWIAPRVDWTPQDAIAGGPFNYESPETLPLDAFQTSIPGLHVLGACAAVSRTDAAQITLAPNAIILGERLGKTVEPAVSINPKECTLFGKASTDSRRRNTIRDFHDDSLARIELKGLPELSVLANVDVLVVGGGTGGAPAAIAAAREGVKTLVLEGQYDLGGTGTLGCISRYCCGWRHGFTEEITRALRQASADPAHFNRNEWDSVHKGDWMRREIEKAGGKIWFGAMATGALRKGNRICGVIVSTPWGSGIVEATTIIDATGSADIAFAAGCGCTAIAEDNLAIQGAGLPSLLIPPCYHNTDYTFIDDNNPADVTRAMVVARRRFHDAFDLSPIPGTRERRQIAGDVTVRPQDVYTKRTWHDTICHSVSDFDSHGYVLSPLFHILPSNPHYIYEADLPMRALLPRGTVGLAVTGLAISGDRDAMPIFRMQPDIQNHAFAIGLAAAMAIATNGEFRDIPIRTLQRKLMPWRLVPESALVQDDMPPWPDAAIESAANGSLDLYSELSVLLDGGKRSIPYLKHRLGTIKNDLVKLQCAKTLAALGDDSGEKIIINHIESAKEWDAGWNFKGMGQFGASESELDGCIHLLTIIRSTKARNAILVKIGQLGDKPVFSHVRALCVYAQAFADPVFAKPLADVLRQNGLNGHDWQALTDELADIPPDTNDTTTRNRSLIELCLAKAILLCGDDDGIAEKILRRYANDVRGTFAKYARITLARYLSKTKKTEYIVS